VMPGSSTPVVSRSPTPEGQTQTQQDQFSPIQNRSSHHQVPPPFVARVFSSGSYLPQPGLRCVATIVPESIQPSGQVPAVEQPNVASPSPRWDQYPTCLFNLTGPQEFLAKVLMAKSSEEYPLTTDLLVHWLNTYRPEFPGVGNAYANSRALGPGMLNLAQKYPEQFIAKRGECYWQFHYKPRA
jgi:hypothetical protein